ncbi:MAG: hypothetical protein JNK67_06975 [Alphaproteobacteria bacterium]|nr:hypothetical protein [Alphaproteobacteria bacterium]
MARLPLAGALACLLACGCVGLTALAQTRPAEPPATPAAPDAIARAALDALRRALAEALQGLPQYSAPEFTERGDIIIRRIPAAPPVTPPRSRSVPRFDDVST